LGQVLLQVLVEYRFDMAQAAQLLEQLDDDMTMRLQKTVEYYDLLEDLYKHNLVSRYHIPREVKKLKKRQKVEAKVSDDVVVESVVVSQDDVASTVDESDVGETELNTIEDTVVETLSFSENDYDAAVLDEQDEIPEEEEYEFSTGEESRVQVEEDTEEEFSFAGGFATVPVKETMKSFLPKDDGYKKHAGELKREQQKELEEEMEEMKEEGLIEETPKKVNTAIICVVAGCFVLLIVLAILFVKISLDRARAVVPSKSDSAYNTTYNAEDVAKYELGDKGELILKDENGAVLYDSSNQTAVVSPEEEMDISIMTEEEDENTVTQHYNDISGFENGASYKGLDLVNLINGTQGANCSLQKTNGAVVEITRGNASLEDFLPSGMYQCQISEGVLTFIEQ